MADLQRRLGPCVLQGKIFFNWFHLYHFIFLFRSCLVFCFVLFLFLVFFWGGGVMFVLVLLSVDQTVGKFSAEVKLISA